MVDTRIINKRILKSDIKNILIEDCDNKPFLALLDNWRNLAPEDEIKHYIASDSTDRRQYLPEINDCDNFAFDFISKCSRETGWCVGAAIINCNKKGMHVICWYITDTEKLVYFEPQTDKEYTEDFTVIAFIQI